MSTITNPSFAMIDAAPSLNPAGVRGLVKTGLLGSLAVWLIISLLQIAAMPANEANGGLLHWVRLVLLANLPFMLYCWGQFLVFMRMGVRVTSMRATVQMLAVASMLVFLPLIFYQAILRSVILGEGAWTTAVKVIAAYPPLFWTFDYMVFLGCFAAVFALSVRRQNLDEVRHRHAAESENLRLHLALERQRMVALQAQLEPHFMFNALNAISALMRADQKRLALTALSQLSMLLRYALISSERQWVQVREELDFVRDYLALQGLRFDDRLRMDIDVGVPEEGVEACRIPPLLLQPLVENIVRHDLERHTGPSHARLQLAILDGNLHIHLRNPDRAGMAPNAGLGVGLSNTRARLQLLFGDAAALETAVHDGDFVIHLFLPAEQDD